MIIVEYVQSKKIVLIEPINMHKKNKIVKTKKSFGININEVVLGSTLHSMKLHLRNKMDPCYKQRPKKNWKNYRAKQYKRNTPSVHQLNNLYIMGKISLDHIFTEDIYYEYIGI